MSRAAKYRRISDDREGRELGVTRQDEDLNTLATRNDLTIVADYCDNDVSASTRSRKIRPEYKRLLADAKAGAFDVVLAYTSGRLTRRPREHEDLIELAEEYGTRFVYVASPSFDLNTSAGRRIARILAANDAGEAEDIGERVQRQKEQASAAGRWKGNKRPFGYERDGVTVRPAEADVLRDIANQILVGASLRGIARDLNDRGITTSTGAGWDTRTVRQMLLRPRNAGLVEHRGKILAGVTAEWPALLDEATWRAMCAVLEDPTRLSRTEPIPDGRVHLLSKLARCGVCRAPVEVKYDRKPGMVEALRVYKCPTHHVSRRLDLVDATVEAHMVRRLQRADAVDLIGEEAAEQSAALHTQAAVLRERLDALAEQFADGDIDEPQLARGTRRLRTRMSELAAAIAETSRRSVLAGLAGADDVEVRWRADLPLDRKRRIIASMAEVLILPTRRGRPPGWRKGAGSYFDPETIQVIWRD
jgi:site-specific DNA recombinase